MEENFDCDNWLTTENKTLFNLHENDKIGFLCTIFSQPNSAK